MKLNTLTAALTAAVLAVGMAGCDRNDNAGAGSSVERDKARTGSAAGGSSAPTSPSGSTSGASKSPAPAGSK